MSYITGVTTDIAKIPEREATRYAISAALAFNVPNEEGKVYLAATDSRCLAVVMVDGHIEGEQQLIPGQAIPAGMKSGKPTAERSGNYWVNTSDRCGRVPEGRFPQVEDVMPILDGVDSGDYIVNLDAELLLKVAKAINKKSTGSKNTRVRLVVRRQPGESICILPEEFKDDANFGILMPWHSEHDEEVPAAWNDKVVKFVSARKPTESKVEKAKKSKKKQSG